MLRRRFEFYREGDDVGKDAVMMTAESAKSKLHWAGPIKLARQSPPMDPIDEMIFLLHTAAEIEHSLLAQYLYAAWSLPEREPQRRWREGLIAIAREEMGHLMSVQNLLLALGGGLNFEREDYPFNEFYPFPFRLEPLSVQLLARVVLAEMPDPAIIPPELGFDLAQVRADADEQGDVDRVGALFELIIQLAEEVGNAGFNGDSLPFQADPNDWWACIFNLVLTKAGDRDEAKKLLEKIAEQGEGHTEPDVGPSSHFRRLFEVYNEAKQFLDDSPGAQLALPLPVNPTVNDPDADGYLGLEDAHAWGVAFNQRFHWVLLEFAHLLTLDASDSDRRELRSWTVVDMRALSEMAGILIGLPQVIPPKFDSFGRPIVAGPPLELPHSLSLPDRPIDRWRAQARLAHQHIAQLRNVGDQTTAASMIADIEPRVEWIRKRHGV
jgi:rubrerythrin